MFSSVLRQILVSATMRIISIDELCKDLSLTYNFNTSSQKMHVQKFVSILQGIMASTKPPPQDLLLMIQSYCSLIQ